MPNIVPSSNGQSRVTCRGMDVDLFKARPIEDFSVGYAIKCHSSREAHSLQTRARRKLLEHAEINLVKARLQCGCQISVPLFERLLRIAFWPKASFHSFRKYLAERGSLVRLSPADFMPATVMRDVIEYKLGC